MSRPPSPKPPRSAGSAKPRRGGRPSGTAGLNAGVQATIVSFIRAGAFDHVAAEAADISARTFRDWMARGEARHPTRPATPRFRAFARAVRKAKAEVRLAAEARVYRENPIYWLSRAAKTTPDRDGWTEPARAAASGSPQGFVPGGMDEEQLDRLLAALLAAGELVVPACAHPRCRCPHHRRRGGSD